MNTRNITKDELQLSIKNILSTLNTSTQKGVFTSLAEAAQINYDFTSILKYMTDCDKKIEDLQDVLDHRPKIQQMDDKSKQSNFNSFMKNVQ